MKSSKGLTLVELMVAMAVAVVMLGIGLPALQGVVSSNQVVGYNNRLVGDLGYTRSEAIGNEHHIAICASNINQTACSGTDWNNGWIVFEDVDEGDDLDAAETILRATSIAPDERAGLVFDVGAPTVIRFNSNGDNVAGVALTLSFQRDGCIGSQAREVTVSVLGRASVEHIECF